MLRKIFMAAIGTNANLMVEIDGVNAPAGANGLVPAGGGSTVRGLVINQFNDSTEITGKSGNHTTGNFLGTWAI